MTNIGRTKKGKTQMSLESVVNTADIPETIFLKVRCREFGGDIFYMQESFSLLLGCMLSQLLYRQNTGHLIKNRSGHKKGS